MSGSTSALGKMAPAAGQVAGNMASSAESAGIQAAGAQAVNNDTSNAGTGALGNFNSMLSSFMANSQQSLSNQIEMQNAQLMINQGQQIASQTAKTAQSSIDKMDVK